MEHNLSDILNKINSKTNRVNSIVSKTDALHRIKLSQIKRNLEFLDSLLESLNISEDNPEKNLSEIDIMIDAVDGDTKFLDWLEDEVLDYLETKNISIKDIAVKQTFKDLDQEDEEIKEVHKEIGKLNGNMQKEISQEDQDNIVSLSTNNIKIDLLKLADNLDTHGLHKEADFVDSLLKYL